MDTTTVAAKTTRLERGICLYNERGAEIERIGINTYRAPVLHRQGLVTRVHGHGLLHWSRPSAREGRR